MPDYLHCLLYDHLPRLVNWCPIMRNDTFKTDWLVQLKQSTTVHDLESLMTCFLKGSSSFLRFSRETYFEFSVTGYIGLGKRIKYAEHVDYF